MNILEQVNDDWWWAEFNGSHGYVPCNHLVDTPPVQWENEEYFDSYSNLVSVTHLSLSCPSLPLMDIGGDLHFDKFIIQVMIFCLGFEVCRLPL